MKYVFSLCLWVSVVNRLVISHPVATSMSRGCQIRHLARIFTVDNPGMQELNSFRQISNSTNANL